MEKSSNLALKSPKLDKVIGAYQIRKVFLLWYLSELRLIRVSGVGKQLLELEMAPRTAPRSYKSDSLV